MYNAAAMTSPGQEQWKVLPTSLLIIRSAPLSTHTEPPEKKVGHGSD